MPCHVRTRSVLVRLILLLTLPSLALLLAVLPAAHGLAQTYGSRALTTGSSGADVADLQVRLHALGYLPHPADATFGPATWGALAAFQRDAGLVPSGTAGAWTVSVLDRAFAWQRGVWHTVAPGEGLAGVAARYGTTPAVVRWLNRLQGDGLVPGQRLRVPPGSGRVEPAPESPTPGPVPPAADGSAAGAPAEVPPAPPGVPETPAPSPADPQPPAPPPAPAPQPPLAGTGRPLVLGYYAEDWAGDRRGLLSLQQTAGRVDAVVTFQFLTDDQGNLTGPAMPQLMAEAVQQGIPVLGLVHNYVAGGFDREMARRLLESPERRAAAAARMSDTLIGAGFQGINVDIENVPPALRDGYTDFVRLLAARLRPAGLVVTLSIPAKVADNPRDTWSGGFDYAALAQLADLIVLMTYDQHLPGVLPGPVAGYDWVERVLRYATTQIPPEKVLMGVPTYGYDWLAGTREARGLSAPVVLSLAQQHGATVAWDPVARSPYFHYLDSLGRQRIVHFDNAASTAEKLALVRQYGLRGIAIWRLGYEDPAIWPVISAGLADPPGAVPDGAADPRAGAPAATGSPSG